MKKIVSFLVFSVFLFSIVGNNSTKASYNDIDTHLKEFVEFNEVHHDNIDDEPHSHKHKHSDDGEEIGYAIQLLILDYSIEAAS